MLVSNNIGELTSIHNSVLLVTTNLYGYGVTNRYPDQAERFFYHITESGEQGEWRAGSREQRVENKWQ